MKGNERFWSLDVECCMRMQRELVNEWNRDIQLRGSPAQPLEKTGCLAAVITNHYHNHRLWQLEDEARRPDFDDAAIGFVKRMIDRENQLRNDAIERIDEELQRRLDQHGVSLRANAYRHSETPGAILDRLSILALKTYHMTRQAEREDVSEEHRRTCLSRAAILCHQRVHLHRSLRWLVTALEKGASRLVVYRQFKMYNDPNLNPAIYLYRSSSRDHPGSDGGGTGIVNLSNFGADGYGEPGLGSRVDLRSGAQAAAWPCR